MRWVNMLRTFRYVGVAVGCGIAPTAMALPYVYVDEPLIAWSSELALVPTTKAKAVLLSSMNVPLIVRLPKGPDRASLLKFVARGNAQQAVTALSALTTTAMAGATTQCVALTYDKNGNRISQTVALMAAAPVTWGGGVYGCFVWAA